jgi:hypothetical protein
MRAGAATLAILGAGILAAAGCSTVLGVDANRYLATDDAPVVETPDAAAEAADPGQAMMQPAPDWSCLGALREIDPTQHVTVTVTVIDEIPYSASQRDVDGGSGLATVDGRWLPGVAVRPCSLRDTDCMEGQNTVVTDDAGRAKFTLPGDFAGFFAVERLDLVPATLYPGRLIPGENSAAFTALTMFPAELDDLLGEMPTISVLGADAGLGVAIVTTYDCQDHQARDISVSYTGVGLQTVPYYFQDGLPVPVPQANATDDYGQAGAINLPAGSMMVTAKRISDQRTVGSASVGIRPGGLSVVLIRARAP